MASIETYIEKFHQLEGITLGERRCSFNHYFKDVTSFLTKPEDIKKYSDGLKPQNRLEEVFYLALLLKYKQQNQLLAILYNEDSALIKLILKDGAFVENTFTNADTERFMEFMNKVSFVVRSKVITKLSKLPQAFPNNKLDSYYFALKEKYGLDIGKKLLSGCALETIKGELLKHKILFTNNQVTRIYERSNDFLETYFAHLKKNNHTDFRHLVKVIKMVALKNEQMYWKLLKEYEFDYKLSYKQTTVVISNNKEEIIKDTSKYLPILNKHAIIPCLTSEEFKLFFANILPKTIEEVDNALFNKYADAMFYLFKFASKDKRFEILQEVFKTKYNTNMLNHEDFFNEFLLELVPVTDRVAIIENKLKKDPPEETYIAFYDTDKALEVLKKKISHTADATKRHSYVEMLIKSCKVNSDMKRWPEILDYILNRHKNEDNSFYSVIFRSIEDNCSLAKFDQEMWNTINGMVEGFKFRFKTSDHSLQTFEDAYMKFKIKNNQSIVEEVSEILKERYKYSYWCRFWGDPVMKKKCIEIMSEVIPNQFEGKKLRQAINFYYNIVKNHNRQHKTKRINILKHDFVVKYWESIIADENSEKTCIFDDLKFVRGRPELVKKITQLIWEGKRTENYQWRWFLKYQPADIVQHYEKFFEDKSFDRTGLGKFPYNVTFFSHLGIPELFHKKSKELLESKDLPGESHQYIAAVKFLVHHKDFVDIIQPLLPKESTTIDPPIDGKNLAEVQQSIAKVLGQYKEKSNTLDALAAIAKGDNLQFALLSMHKIMYHTAEYKLKGFLEKISGGSVSLRKHVIFIIAGMSTVENVYETFKKIGETERNSSVRTYLLRTTLEYFQLNPSNDFFDLSKQHAKLLEPVNQEGYALLVDLNKIPIEFISSYIDFVLEFIMENTDKNILELRYKLLNNINKIIMEQINDELLHKIVVKCLDFEKDELQNVYKFVYQYIIDRDIKKVEDRISLVMKQFPKRENDLKKARACININVFIIGFCKDIINKKNDKKTKHIDTKLIFTGFSKLLSEDASLNSSIWLKLTKMYLDTQDKQMFIHDFGHFYTETVKKLSLFVIYNFAEIFSDFVSTVVIAEELKLQDTLMDFLYQFLVNDSGIQRELFATLVLPKNISKSEHVYDKHLVIMKMLNDSKSDVVKTAVCCYLETISFVKKH